MIVSINRGKYRAVVMQGSLSYQSLVVIQSSSLIETACLLATCLPA